MPLNVLAADHVGAPQTVHRLAEEYTGNERVQIYVIDNSNSDVQQARVLVEKDALDFLEEIRHNEMEALHQQAEEVLKDEVKKRRGTLRAIPNYIVTALRQRYRRRTRS